MYQKSEFTIKFRIYIILCWTKNEQKLIVNDFLKKNERWFANLCINRIKLV